MSFPGGRGRGGGTEAGGHPSPSFQPFPPRPRCPRLHRGATLTCQARRTPQEVREWLQGRENAARVEPPGCQQDHHRSAAGAAPARRHPAGPPLLTCSSFLGDGFPLYLSLFIAQSSYLGSFVYGSSNFPYPRCSIFLLHS